MQVAKWGNSLAVRLPVAVVEALHLKPGDDIEIVVQDDRSFAVKKKRSREEMILSLRELRGMMPPDFKFNREEANER